VYCDNIIAINDTNKPNIHNIAFIIFENLLSPFNIFLKNFMILYFSCFEAYLTPIIVPIMLKELVSKIPNNELQVLPIS